MKKVRLYKNEKIITGDCRYVITKFNSFKYLDLPSNCKFCYLDNAELIALYLGGKNSLKLHKILDDIFFINSKITFGVNVAEYSYIECFSKFFTLISCVKIPLGYCNESQYHAIFFANNYLRDADEYRERLLEEGVELLANGETL